MNYELIHSDLTAAAQFTGDLLVVLTDHAYVSGKNKPRSAVERFWQRASDRNALGFAEPGQLTGFSVEGCLPNHLVLSAVGANAKRDVGKALGQAIAYAKSVKAQRVMVCFSALQTLHEADLSDAIASISAGLSVYTDTKPSAKDATVTEVTLGVTDVQAMRGSYNRAIALASGLEFSKKWANRPANHATPKMLAEAALSLAKYKNVECKVLTLPQVKRLKMGCFIGVAQGSLEPLQFIELRYRGAGAKQAPTVLVGKGITFDSGGISIKPAAEMDEMVRSTRLQDLLQV